MNETQPETSLLSMIKPTRLYSSSILRAARHFWTVRDGVRVNDLADELQKNPPVTVVAVLDAEGIVLGLVQRDRLFAMLGKPFGREVLSRSCAAELAEKAPSFDSHAEIFGVAQEVLSGPEEERSPYYLLTDEGGRFQGILATQDLANYLSRITQDDIELAGQLQERLVSGNELLEGVGWRFEAWSRSAKGVGGDFYFTRQIDEKRAFFALCDVSGKGVAASLIVSMVWGMLRMYDFRRGLRSLVLSLNESIVATFHMEKYLTGFFMIYDQSARKLISVDMGHSHAFLFRNGGAHHFHGARANLPIGIEREVDPAVYGCRLAAGDNLVVYSDGITEQENADGHEFGEERLVAVALGSIARHAPLQSVLPTAVDGHRGKTPQQDDMSFMVLALS